MDPLPHTINPLSQEVGSVSQVIASIQNKHQGYLITRVENGILECSEKQNQLLGHNFGSQNCAQEVGSVSQVIASIQNKHRDT